MTGSSDLNRLLPLHSGGSTTTPLSPKETVTYVKALRKQLRKNMRKVQWRENRGATIFLYCMLVVMVVIAVPLVGSLLYMALSEVDDSSWDDMAQEWETEDENSSSEERCSMFTIIGLMIYGLLLFLSKAPSTDIMTLSGQFTRLHDRSFLYAAPLDRHALARWTMRQNIQNATIIFFILGMCAVLFHFMGSPIVPQFLWMAFCNFFFSLEHTIVDLHGTNRRFRVLADAGGVSATVTPKCSAYRLSLLFSLVSPFILAGIFIFPPLGIILLIAFPRVWQFWKATVLHESTELWHEDVRVVSLTVQQQQASSAGAQYRSYGTEVREIPEQKKDGLFKKWFDPWDYSLDESTTEYEALVNMAQVVHDRTVHKTDRKIAIAGILISAALFSLFRHSEDATICSFLILFLSLFTGGMIMSMGQTFGTLKSRFDMMFLLPLKGRNVIMDAFLHSARFIAIFLFILFAILLFAVAPDLSTEGALWVISLYLALSMLFITMAAVSPVSYLRSHKNGAMKLSGGYEEDSETVGVFFILFLAVIAVGGFALIGPFLFGVLFTISVQFGIALLLSYVSYCYLKLAIRLYDTGFMK